MTKQQRTAETSKERGTNRRPRIESRGIDGCCPFVSRVRYHKMQSLTEYEMFDRLNGDLEKKRQMTDKAGDYAGTTDLFYL